MYQCVHYCDLLYLLHKLYTRLYLESQGQARGPKGVMG